MNAGTCAAVCAAVVLTLGGAQAAYGRLAIAPDGNLPVAMIGAAACFSPAGDLVTVGGFTGTRSLREVFIRRQGQWRVLARLPAPTHDAAAGYLNGHLFVFGGGQAYSTRDLFRIQDGRAVRVAWLGHPLSDAVARPYRWHGVQGLVLVGGHGGPPVRTVYFIAGNGAGHTRWQTLFRLPVGVRYPAVAVDGATVFVAGGLSSRGPVATVWTWHPGQAAPHALPSLPQPLQKAAAFAWRGTYYVAGGLGASGTVSRKILAYHAGQAGWRVVARLPRPLADMAYAQTGATVYLLGGMSRNDAHAAQRRIWRLRLE